jgi:hypothetical protein
MPSSTAARLLAAAQHGADAGQQLARIARLGQVVVGAQFQADDAVGLLAHGRQHDDGGAVGGRQAAADGQAVLAGQHDVEHHQIDRASGQHLFHGAGVGRGLDGVAVATQEVGHDVADAGIVVDDEDTGAAHRARSGAGRRRRSRSRA